MEILMNVKIYVYKANKSGGVICVVQEKTGSCGFNFGQLFPVTT